MQPCQHEATERFGHRRDWKGALSMTVEHMCQSCMRPGSHISIGALDMIMDLETIAKAGTKGQLRRAAAPSTLTGNQTSEGVQP